MAKPKLSYNPRIPEDRARKQSALGRHGPNQGPRGGRRHARKAQPREERRFAGITPAARHPRRSKQRYERRRRGTPSSEGMPLARRHLMRAGTTVREITIISMKWLDNPFNLCFNGGIGRCESPARGGGGGDLWRTRPRSPWAGDATSQIRRYRLVRLALAAQNRSHHTVKTGLRRWIVSLSMLLVVSGSLMAVRPRLDYVASPDDTASRTTQRRHGAAAGRRTLFFFSCLGEISTCEKQSSVLRSSNCWS